MGRFIGYLTFLIFLDLLFIITGQIGVISGTSIIVNSILQLNNITGNPLYTAVFIVAICGIAVTAGVNTGIINKAGIDLIAFVALAIVLATLGADFAGIFGYMATQNLVLATMIFAPIILIYLFTVAEWLRGKD